jgi:molybdopterin-guanine dinucleotide biosynthesis protein A
MISIVLAGGRSARLGGDKSSLHLGGGSLLQRIISRLAPLSSEVFVVLAQGSEETSPPGARTVTDIYPNKGPLGGIYSGLMSARDFHSIVVACDMPFLNTDLLRYMSELAHEFDVVIPAMGDKLEPLHAIYSRNCLEPIEGLLKQSKLKITKLLPQVRVRYVGQDELDRFDPEHLSFFNINTKNDLKRARELVYAHSGTSLGTNPQLC